MAKDLKLKNGKTENQPEKQKSYQKKPFHRTCQTLPLRKLVNLRNSRINDVGDSRHILEEYYWEDDYQDEELAIHVENILKEWDELTGSRSYEQMFEKQDSMLYDNLRIKVLDLSYRIHGVVEYSKVFSDLYEDEELNELVDELQSLETNVLKDFKFSYLKSQNDMVQKSKQIESKLTDDLKEYKEKSEKAGKWSFEDMILPIEIRLKKDVDLEITCNKYISYINILKSH